MFQVTLVIISTSVFVYCWFYIEPTEYTRFSITILVFIIAIMIFICHERLLLLLTGWDGLGASSFLLVIHYWRWGSLGGGLITLLTNRVGDICIFVFFGTCVVRRCSDDLSVIQTLTPQVFLVIRGCTKRAQTPFSRWLPLAISAPTPVSSLVHRRTLVTAGVYLFQRYFYCLTDRVLCYLLVVGLATRVVGGFGALVEPDTKKSLL
jgi:NADH-ubiquinone oxidoreductase chain 5